MEKERERESKKVRYQLSVEISILCMLHVIITVSFWMEKKFKT